MLPSSLMDDFLGNTAILLIPNQHPLLIGESAGSPGASQNSLSPKQFSA